MEKQNKSVKEALDSFDEYLYESTSGNIVKDYNESADRILEEQKTLSDDSAKEREKIQAEYDKKLESDENSELLVSLDRKLSSQIYLENQIKNQIENRFGTDSDDADSSTEFGLSDETILRAINDLLTEFIYPENKKPQLFDKFAETSLSAEEISEKESLLSDIDKLEKENDKIEKSERMKFLIFALISFAVAVVFIILGVTIIEASMVFNTIAGIGIIGGIVFLVLRAKVYKRSKAIDINEKKIKNDKKRLEEIKEAQKSKLAEKIKHLKLDYLKKEHALIEKYNKDSDELSSKLKKYGDEAVAKLKAKEKELMSGVSDMCLTVFGKVKEMSVKYQHEFIEECRIRNVQSETEMLDVYKSLKRDYDEEISRKKREEDERLANEEMIRQAQEQNRILEDQARQAKMAADEQNRLLKQQAAEQKRQQDEAKRIGYDFKLGMCPQCKNWIGCRMKDHLTGPCPSYIKK